MPRTIKEALAGRIGYPIPDGSLEDALTDAGLVSTANYDKSHSKTLDIAAAGLLLFVCTSPNISEGGYSISVADKAALLKVRSLYLSKWGISDDSLPKIEDGTGLW